ncbi:MAG TPA: chemotaxis protein CheR [Chromatiales bacterium]|nr:chemotaxis protein CheR [Chromatiales bacterium]
MAIRRDFEFSDRDFVRIRDLVKQHAGITLTEAKKDMVYSRLSRRLRHLGITSFSEYCRLVEDEASGELVNFTNSITTNLTAFFREQHHFDYLANTLLPRLRKEKAGSRRLRIWSAGCSTGEEPYSLAMTVLENLPAHEHWDVKILATDLDSNVLETAQRGVYTMDRIKGISNQRLKRWFLKGRHNKDAVRVNPELQELISFRQLNLLRPWPFRGPFDFIFCRNVVIYFDKPTQKILFERYADMLELNSHLFIGHSESLFKVTDRFKLIGQTIYIRTR